MGEVGLRIIAAACLALALAGGRCELARAEEGDAARLAAALKEGRAMLYGETPTPNLRAIKQGFEKKYPGITVEFVYLSGAPLMNRVMSEQDAGRYVADVLMLDAVRLPALVEKHYLAHYVSPEQVHYDERWLSKPPGYWILNHLYPTGIMYNRQEVSADKAPRTFEDLLDPEWKGKIALVSPVANDLMLYFYAGLVRDMGEAKAFAFFRGLAAQKPLIFGPGGIRVSQGIHTGEFPVGIGFLAHVYNVGGGESGNMAFVATDPIYLASGPATAVMEHAPHPDAARLLADYIDSREVQDLLSGFGYFSSYNGIKRMPAMEKLKVSAAPTPVGAEAEALRGRLSDIFGP